MLEYNDKTNERSDRWTDDDGMQRNGRGFIKAQAAGNSASCEVCRLVCRGKFFLKRSSIQNILPACETRLGCSLETIISDELYPGCEVKT